jgi:hypothetical protein
VRVLHAPLNVANDAWSLSRGQRALGVSANVAALRSGPFVHRPDIDLELAERGMVSRQLTKIGFTARALATYDVFHFSFAASIIDYGDGPFCLMDLITASRLGRRVAMTFHGCDVRPLQPGGCAICGQGCLPGRAQHRLDVIRRHTDLLYVTTPDLLRAVPDARLMPPSVWDLESLAPAPPRLEGPLRVVHAPSDRGIKGTSAVESAVKRLRAAGLAIEITLVEHMPRHRALEAYRQADVAVDQLRVGWYGVFAVEMMAMAKPVVARIDEGAVALSELPAPPCINADETTLEDVLGDLVERRSSLSEIGRQSRQFVLARHDPRANAARSLADYARCRQGGLLGVLRQRRGH